MEEITVNSTEKMITQSLKQIRSREEIPIELELLPNSRQSEDQNLEIIEKEQVNEISWASLHLNMSEQNSQKRISLPRKAKRKKNMFRTTHFHNNRLQSCKICLEGCSKIEILLSSTNLKQGSFTISVDMS